MAIINLSFVCALALFGLIGVVLLVRARKRHSTRFLPFQPLFVESLEPRLAPATITLHWKYNPNNSTGDILDPRNWDEGVTPGPSRILEFDNSTGIAILRADESVVVAGIVMNHFPKNLDIAGKMQVGSDAVPGVSKLSGGDIHIDPTGSLTLINGTLNWNTGDITKGPQGKGNLIISTDAKVVITGGNKTLNANTTVTGTDNHRGTILLQNATRSLWLDSTITIKNGGQLQIRNTQNLCGGISGGAIILDGGHIGSGPGVQHATQDPIPLSSLYAVGGMLDDDHLFLSFSDFYFGGGCAGECVLNWRTEGDDISFQR